MRDSVSKLVNSIQRNGLTPKAVLWSPQAPAHTSMYNCTYKFTWTCIKVQVVKALSKCIAVSHGRSIRLWLALRVFRIIWSFVCFAIIVLLLCLLFSSTCYSPIGHCQNRKAIIFINWSRFATLLHSSWFLTDFVVDFLGLSSSMHGCLWMRMACVLLPKGDELLRSVSVPGQAFQHKVKQKQCT